MSAGERNVRKKGGLNVKGRSAFNISKISGGLAGGAMPYEEDILSAPRIYSGQTPKKRGADMRSTNMLLNRLPDCGKLVGIN